MMMRFKYILYTLCFVVFPSTHAAIDPASFQAAVEKLNSLKSAAPGPAHTGLKTFLASRGYLFNPVGKGWVGRFAQFKTGKMTASDLLAIYNIRPSTAQAPVSSGQSASHQSGRPTSPVTESSRAPTDYELAIENGLVQAAATSGSKEAVLEQLELYFPDLKREGRQRVLQHFAHFLSHTAPTAQPSGKVSGAAVADDKPAPAEAPLAFGHSMIAQHAGVYSIGFDGDPQCRGHYRGFYPKAPIIHNYFPAILNIANNFTLRFPPKAYALLPGYVKGHLSAVGLTDIFVVTQAYTQIVQDQGGKEGVICFRPQTWISPAGTPFNAQANVQMIDWQHNVHQMAHHVRYSIHDGVSSPCAPDVRGILNLEGAMDHTRLVWSRTQHGGRTALTAHLFVPDRFTIFVNDRAPVGRELKEFIHEAKAHVPAVRRVLEEDLGALLR